MSVNLNVTNALTGETLIDLQCDLDSTIIDLKQSLVSPSGLLPEHQKLILEDGTALSNDGQTLKEAGLQAESGCICIQVVATAQKLRRLDSVAKYATVLDKFYATETQAELDFIKGFDLTALSREALKDNPDVGLDEAATNKFMADLTKKMHAECDAAMTERLREDTKLVFDQYDTNGDGSLAQDEIEKLLADMIVLSQKNLPLTIDTMISTIQDTSLGMAKVLMKTQIERAVKAMNPGLEGPDLEQEVDGMMQQYCPPDDEFRAQMDQSFHRPQLIEGISKLLQDIADDKDTFSTAMAEEMDKNHDGKVDRAEFSAHYRDAMTKVIDMDKWIQEIMKVPAA